MGDEDSEGDGSGCRILVAGEKMRDDFTALQESDAAPSNELGPLSGFYIIYSFIVKLQCNSLHSFISAKMSNLLTPPHSSLPLIAPPYSSSSPSLPITPPHPSSLLLTPPPLPLFALLLISHQSTAAAPSLPLIYLVKPPSQSSQCTHAKLAFDYPPHPQPQALQRRKW